MSLQNQMVIGYIYSLQSFQESGYYELISLMPVDRPALRLTEFDLPSEDSK